MLVPTIVLGSRSPRRRDLLIQLVGDSRLQICVPLDTEELGFAGLHDMDSIERRLLKIVSMKFNDVRNQLSPDLQDAVVVVADTIVIATDESGQRIVLGQPDQQPWQPQVRRWFHEYLSGTTHSVWTAFLVSRSGQIQTHVVRTEVSFANIPDRMIDWYLSTGESRGKAGGYGIQGHAASFVCGLQGSLTNVIGLPVLEVASALQALGIEVSGVADGAGDAERTRDADHPGDL